MAELPYYDDTSAARLILPIRDIGVSSDCDIVPSKSDPTSVTKYEMYCLASGWHTKEKETVCDNEHLVAKRNILRYEDMLFVNGDISLGLIGMSATSTVRHDLTKALAEYPDYAVVTSSKFLNPAGRVVIRCPAVKQYEHYLVPVTDISECAEFVVSEDMCEMEPMQHDGKWFTELHEWVAIEFHDVDRIVKVVR